MCNDSRKQYTIQFPLKNSFIHVTKHSFIHLSIRNFLHPCTQHLPLYLVCLFNVHNPYVAQTGIIKEQHSILLMHNSYLCIYVKNSTAQQMIFEKNKQECTVESIAAFNTFHWVLCCETTHGSTASPYSNGFFCSLFLYSMKIVALSVSSNNWHFVHQSLISHDFWLWWLSVFPNDIDILF